MLAELAHRPALFNIDSPRYLFNADGMDPVGYKGPLRAILAVANFGTVAAAQHVLGLCHGVVHLRLLTAAAGDPLAGRAGHGARPAGRLPAPVRAVDHARHLVRGPDRGRPGHPAAPGWAGRGLGWRGGRSAVGGVGVLGASATVAQVGEALILPAVLCVLVAARRLAAAR